MSYLPLSVLEIRERLGGNARPTRRHGSPDSLRPSNNSYVLGPDDGHSARFCTILEA
jgi:hypothetical protein